MISCITQPVSPEPEGEFQGSEMSVIRISVAFDRMTRSSVVSDEYAVRDVGIYAFAHGALVTGAFYDCSSGLPDDMELNLPSGQSYSIYAVANAGFSECPEQEGDMKDFAISVENFSALQGCLPMVWKGSLDVIVGDYGLDIGLVPLAAKVQFSIDDRLLGGLEVTSVRLRQGALSVRPFAEGDSRAEYPDEAADGDWASAEDLYVLNQGGSILLYALENCQGTLLPGNEDPWKKIPDGLSEELAGLCTYIEVGCRFHENTEYGSPQGVVRYRIFLGQDALTDFNVRRNSVQSISLVPTETGLEKLSWMIDASEMYRYGGVVEGAFHEENFHEPDDFYVTERVLFRYCLDETARSFWKGREYVVTGLSSEGKETVSFAGHKEMSPGVWECIGTCRSAGDFDVWLVDAAGVKVTCLAEGGRVKMPALVIGDGGQYAGYDKVEPERQHPDLYINGEAMLIHAYLADDEGFNLNQGHGCDMSLLEPQVVSGALKDSLTFSFRSGASGDGGPVMEICLSCPNDGRSPERNRLLSNALGAVSEESHLCEKFTGLSVALPFRLRADDVTVTLESASSLFPDCNTGSMYRVRNRSCLPFKVRGWRLLDADYDGNAADYEAAVERSDGKVVLGRICATAGRTYYSPLYVSCLPEVLCSFEEPAAVYVRDGETVCFPADDGGISVENACDAVFMDRKVSSDGSVMYPRPVSVSHVLSAVMLYEGSEILEIHGVAEADDEVDRKIVHIDMRFGEDNRLLASSSEEMTLKTRVHGTLRSHIRTLKGNDWLFGIGTSCRYYKNEYGFDSGYAAVALSDDPVVVDASVVHDAFEYIRTVEYWSRYDFEDRREVLKPYAFSMGVDFLPDEDVCLAVNFPDRLIYDYRNVDIDYGNHLSEPPSTWNHSCKDSPDGGVFKDEKVTMEFTVASDIDTGVTLITAR